MSPELFSVFWPILVSNSVVRMIRGRPQISNFFTPFSKPLRVVLSVSIIIGITVTFVFRYFFSSLAKSKSVSLFFPLGFSLYGLPGRPSLQFGRFSISLLLFYFFESVSHQHQLIFFYWSLSDNVPSNL